MKDASESHFVLGPEYEAAVVFAEQAPERASLGSCRASTAGWTDPSLTKAGVFYPRTAKKAADRLRYFSEQFTFVEVDATFYALLSPSVTGGWVSCTPDDFHFHVKAHPILTGHHLDVARLPKDLVSAIPAGAQMRLRTDEVPAELRDELEARFFASLMPLVEARRLDTILLQFPPWFRATRGNARRLEAIRALYPTMPFSVEVRSGDWFEEGRKEKFLRLLAANDFEHVMVDEPQVRGAVPLVAASTGKRVTLRMHGRNHAGWEKKGASVAERFNYLYSPRELREVAVALTPIRDAGSELRIVMNNCVRDFAILGAKGIVRALEELT